jgi:hypothetical protein
MAAPVTLDRIPPATASYVLATAILAGVTGYFIGQGASLGLFSSSSTRRSTSGSGRQAGGKHADDDDWDSESEDEDEDEDAGDLATFEGNRDEVKLVLVVRTDLGMGKGKESFVLPYVPIQMNSCLDSC